MSMWNKLNSIKDKAKGLGKMFIQGETNQHIEDDEFMKQFNEQEKILQNQQQRIDRQQENISNVKQQISQQHKVSDQSEQIFQNIEENDLQQLQIHRKYLESQLLLKQSEIEFYKSITQQQNQQSKEIMYQQLKETIFSYIQSDNELQELEVVPQELLNLFIENEQVDLENNNQSPNKQQDLEQNSEPGQLQNDQQETYPSHQISIQKYIQNGNSHLNNNSDKLEKLQIQLADLHFKNKQLENQLTELSERNTLLNNELNQRKVVILQQKEQIQMNEDQLLKNQTKIVENLDMLEQQVQENKKLKQSLEKIQTELKKEQECQKLILQSNSETQQQLNQQILDQESSIIQKVSASIANGVLEISKQLESLDLNDFSKEFQKRAINASLDEFLFDQKKFFKKISEIFAENIIQLKQKEKEKQEKLINSFKKLQEDNKESQKSVEQLEKYQNVNKQKDDQIKELTKINSEITSQKKILIDQIKELNEKIDILQKQAKEKEKRDRDSQDQMIDILQKKLKESLQYIEQLENEIAQFQDLMLQFQEQMKLQIQKNEELTFNLEQSQQSNSDQAEQINEQNLQLEQLNEQSINMQKQNIQQQTEIQLFSEKYGQNIEELNQLKIELSELLNKYQSEIQTKENLVDKSIITKFLLQFLEENSPYKIKMQVLESLSSILNFSDHQRKKAGLLTFDQKLSQSPIIKQQQQQQQQLNNQNQDQNDQQQNQQQNNVINKFINFLIKDEIE